MQNYNGLINEGSTCYLNSLLQTLFMTYQFRQNVYNYIHDPKKIKQKDSIPYQLQKLFVLLQTKNSPAFSKGLTKSFQWTQADSFQQHDVQQFCRVLFQAIQKSHKNSNWVSDLFSGSMISYINCGKHPRQKQQVFLDLSLPIRNSYNKKQFESLQECLKQYFKPQNLQDKIECQQCNQKVFVEKGLKLGSLPKILTIQLNRFQLNYQNFQRQKLNSFLYYPEILEMHRFLKPYSEIQMKGIPKELKQKMKTVQKQKSSRTTDYGFQNDFSIPQKKIKRKNSDQVETNKQKVQFFDEQGKDKRQKQSKQLSLQEEKQRNLQILANLKSQKVNIDSKMKKIQQKELDNLEDDMLFGTGMGYVTGETNTNTNWNSGSFQKQGLKPSFQKSQTKFQHQQDYYDPSKSYQDHTYGLYAVLVHSGGAYGGHYYAYINDGRDWYKFDDSTVKKVNRYEMRRYGNFDNTSYGANAYLLFYRDVKSFEQSKLQNIIISKQLIEKVENDIELTKTTQPQVSKRQQRLLKLTLGVMIKVLKPSKCQQGQDQFQNIFIQNRFECTFAILREKIKNILNVEFQDQNWRMRRYNKVEQTMHEIYGKQIQHLNLQSYGFRQTAYIAIQSKLSNQYFQQYDPKQIIIKVNNWRPNITLLTQKYLKPQKIYIGEQVSFSNLVKQIKRKFGIQNPVIIKRTFSQTNPITLYSLQQTKKLIELRFFNGLNLYIQPKSQQKKLKWVEQFQAEKFRCLIKYNDPKIGENRDQQIYFDTRKNLGDLKQKLGEILHLDIQNFRIKKSKQSVSQLTAYNKKLNDLKFINNQFIFIQIGKSSKGSVILRRASVDIIQDKIQFNLFQETIIQIDNNINTVNDLLQKLSQIVSISVQRLRIRQYKAYQFAQIFRPSQLVQKIKQKSLIWQILQEQPPKGLQVYLRVFDIMNLQLSALKQVYIDRQASYQELTYILQEQTGIASNKILVWKALSNYVQKQILLDCSWTQTKFIKKTIKEQPLYIGVDGQIIIVKQASQAYKAKAYHQTQSNNRGKGKQTQLKITVVQQEQLKQQQPIKQINQQQPGQASQIGQNSKEFTNQK